jgi:flagellar hook capping protein FlgD
MITSSLADRLSRTVGPLVALTATFLAVSAPASELSQEGAEDVSAAVDASIPRWESYAVSSSRSRISDDGQALNVALAPGDRASFSRAADLTPAPAALLCTFNLSMTGSGAGEANAQVLRMGWNFGASNVDEPDAHTYAALGLGAAAAGNGFQLRDMVGGGKSAVFTGTQAVSWVLNNSGKPMSYAAPNGSVEAVADDRMDVWVGRTRVFDDILTTNPAGRITGLKWYWSRGSGITAFDRFETRTLEAATGSPGVAAEDPSAAIEPESAARNGSVMLGPPVPNPFTGTLRFAYSIPGASAPVDIGVFDVAGRRIRILAHGTQTKGEYEASWDGLGDDGARVRYGVYFLRAAVGETRRISRVVYLHE